MASQSKRKELLATGITHIVNCTDTFECKYPEDFSYLHLKLLDQNNQLLLPVLDAAVEFIAEAHAAGGTVLVHCASGHSRSGSVALAYIMWARGCTYEDALASVRQGRPVVQPIPSFAEQLRIFAALGCVWGPHGVARLSTEQRSTVAALTIAAPVAERTGYVWP